MALFKAQVAVIFLLCFVLLHLSAAQDSPQDYLNAHNRARAQVGVGPMRWDNKLADFARRYANKHTAGDCKLIHSGGPYGENLAGSSGNLSGKDAVNLWVAEKTNYNPNSNKCAPNKVCGHYTQVVWRKSVRVGCAKARCANGGTWIGCNYEPRGNFIGQRPY